MDKFKSNFYLRCSVCGKSGPEKACSRCVKKYGKRFDLTTADGRYQARIVEKAKLSNQREPLVEELAGKLASAQAALGEGHYVDVAEALKDIGRLAKKLKVIVEMRCWGKH